MPSPSVWQASRPDAGSIIYIPFDCKLLIFSCTITLLYILVFIAGAKTSGHFKASIVDKSSLSAIPALILPIIFAVAGAIMHISAHKA